MKQLIAIFFSFTLFAAPKIYDCFIYLNEDEVAIIRFEELYDHVDYFVVVESTIRHSAKPKPLHFWKHKAFNKYKDKIIHIVVDDMPMDTDHWGKQAFQRNAIMRGLTSCNDEDIILLSDCDEIVKADRLPEIIEAVNETDGVVGISSNFFHWKLNLQHHELWRPLIAATTYRHLKTSSPKIVRTGERKKVIEAGAWHFTCMGTKEMLIEKLVSFTHFNDTGCIQQAKQCRSQKGYDKLCKDQAPHFKLTPLSELPRYVQDNAEKLRRKGYFYEE